MTGPELQRAASHLRDDGPVLSGHRDIVDTGLAETGPRLRAGDELVTHPSGATKTISASEATFARPELLQAEAKAMSARVKTMPRGRFGSHSSSRGGWSWLLRRSHRLGLAPRCREPLTLGRRQAWPRPVAPVCVDCRLSTAREGRGGLIEERPHGVAVVGGRAQTALCGGFGRERVRQRT